MYKEDDLNKLKFTKIRSHRINFTYDGVRYSLNTHEDGGDCILKLHNRSNKDVLAGEYGYLNLNEYIKGEKYKFKNNIIYSHIDKRLFLEMIDKFIMCDN